MSKNLLLRLCRDCLCLNFDLFDFPDFPDRIEQNHKNHINITKITVRTNATTTGKLRQDHAEAQSAGAIAGAVAATKRHATVAGIVVPAAAAKHAVRASAGAHRILLRRG